MYNFFKCILIYLLLNNKIMLSIFVIKNSKMALCYRNNNLFWILIKSIYLNLISIEG